MKQIKLKFPTDIDDPFYYYLKLYDPKDQEHELCLDLKEIPEEVVVKLIETLAYSLEDNKIRPDLRYYYANYDKKYYIKNGE